MTKKKAKRSKGVAPKASPPTAKTTKKAFDLSRDSVYTADPITELRICGAAGVIPPEEAGDLDTPPGPDVPVQDHRRLSRPVRPGTIASIARYGVKQPIIIAKIDDVATVIAGKSRVRAARRENRLRMLRAGGEPMIKPRCVMQRDVSPRAILGTMITENNVREDDDLADRIEKLRMYLEVGGSEADAATEFGVKQSTILDWLDYDDHATDETKAAVETGLPASTAAELAKIRDPDEQRAALRKLLSGSKTTQRSARAARALRRGVCGTPTATDRKSQRMLLEHLDRKAAARELEDDAEFWRGVRATLRMVTGSKKSDDKIVDALSAARGSRQIEEINREIDEEEA